MTSVDSMVNMVEREEAFAQPGSFWAHLKEVVQHGVEDLASGYDRLTFDRMDPRIEGAVDGAFVFARALAQAWRTGPSTAPLPVAFLAGTVEGGRLEVRAVPLEAWPAVADLRFHGDGLCAVLPTGTQVRRLRGEGSGRGLALLGPRSTRDQGKGDFTLAVGLAAVDPFLARAMADAGVEGRGAVVLCLFEPNAGPADTLDAGGPVRNSWHLAQSGATNLSHSHLTRAYAKLGQQPMDERWYDQALRDAVQARLVERGRASGLEITNRDVLNALAETSPLRKLLPYHLTQHFPEVEAVFWCLPSDEDAREAIAPGVAPERWDLASPMERLKILSLLKQAQIQA